MKKQDIEIGKRYKINSVEADGVTPWSGIAEVLGFNPRNFPKRTVLALCEDGEECCFVYKECVEEHIHRWVTVSPTRLQYLSSSGNLQSFSLPENARKFVDQFDTHLAHNYKACPKPFTFSI